MGIGMIIKNRRLELHMTQDELAAKTKTTKQTIHKYEAGIVTNLPYNRIILLSEALNCTPAYLMGWEQNEEPANKGELVDEMKDIFTTLPQDKQDQALEFLRFLKGQSDKA